MLRTAPTYIMPAHLRAKQPVAIPEDAPRFTGKEMSVYGGMRSPMNSIVQETGISYDPEAN